MNFIILNKLEEINKRLERIEKTLEMQQETDSKISEHIDFIDNIYNVIRKPFAKALSFYSGTYIEIEKSKNLAVPTTSLLIKHLR